MNNLKNDRDKLENKKKVIETKQKVKMCKFYILVRHNT